MSLRVYEMAHSPYCIPITRALAAFGIPFERVPVPNWDRSEVIRVTGGAYYQVPVLQHGEAVIQERNDDSLDVARYVDRVFAGGRLFPDRFSGVHEILIRYFESDLEAITFKLCDVHYLPTIEDPVARVMVIRHKERRFGRGCVDVWKREEASARSAVDRVLERFDTRLKHGRFLLSDSAPIYTDYALLGVIENLCYGGHHDLSPEHRALRDWRDRLVAFRFEVDGFGDESLGSPTR